MIARRCASQLPLHGHYLARIQRECGMSAEQAESLISAIDRAVTSSLPTGNLSPGPHYQQLLEALNGAIGTQSAAIVSEERSGVASMQQDYEAILAEATRIRGLIEDECRQVQAGVQLDISFERKRMEEAMQRVKELEAESERYEEARMVEANAHLQNAFWRQLRETALVGLGRVKRWLGAR